MTQVTAWVGAGVFTAGISAAMLAGAGTANAAEDGAPKQDTRAATQDDSAQRFQHQNARLTKQQPKFDVRHATAADKQANTKQQDSRSTARVAESDRPLRDSTDAVRAKLSTTFGDSARDVRSAAREFGDATHAVVEDATRNVTEKPVRLPVWRLDPAAKQRDLPVAPTLRNALASASPAQDDPVEAVHDVLRSLGALVINPEPQDYPKPLSVLTDAVFGTLATLERVAGGDPVVPPELRDSVQVSTSTLVISEGHEVESNWYIPVTDNGKAPTRLIYLQHGFLANGPLYSYTASHLAAETNSIVVTTTFSSNPFAADGMWLGGNNLHAAVAQLFLDPDRAALNDSLDAAEHNAGRTDEINVPTEFVLVGHSLGGGFAPGVAGYYAEGLVDRRKRGLAAPNDLEGVVMYDAVPIGSIIPDAMDRLEELETNGTADPSDDDAADYIPVYEIGAPLNYLNVFSDVNDQLTQARPGQFTGVVLEDGVHMDSMQGGNPLIQVVAYVVAGFPQPQNLLAVRSLSAGWINDMFDDDKIDPATGACRTGATCAGQYGDGDDSFTISTGAEGDAVAVLIGSQRASELTSLRAISVTDFVSAIPAGVLNALETTCDLFSGGNCPV